MPFQKEFLTRLDVDEAKLLAPDFTALEVPATFGEAASKVTISSVSDLDKLASLIRRCYKVEAAKH